MTAATMTFGRHRGEPANEVSIEYLLWAASSMPTPPPCVVEELKRRAEKHGSREAVDAAAAVSSLIYRQAKTKGKKKRKQWRRFKAKRLRSR